MPRSLSQILSDEEAARLADIAERYDPQPGDRVELPVRVRLQKAALRRAHAEREVLDAVASARAEHVSWAQIGQVLGTSGEAARHRYRDIVA